MSLTYYDYSQDPLIAVDIETKDPELREKGNGVYRKDGYILGVAISNGELSEYYPWNHYDISPEEKAKNMNYIQSQLKATNSKVFANGLYDLDWLINYEGMEVNGSWEDVQIAEPLLDEYKNSYSLDSLSQYYLGEGKAYSGIEKYMEEKNISGKVGPNLWKIPSGVVRPYAEEDVKLTYKVLETQKTKLSAQNLNEVYDLEMSLFPLLLQMRKQGVRMDEQRLSRTGLELADLQYDLQKEMDQLANTNINVNSGPQLEVLFKNLDLPVVYGEPTERMIEQGRFRGNPSFSKAVLQKLNHPVARKILELRHIKTLLNMFIHPYPELMVAGRLHCQFNPLKSDDYGTVSGRFSSSKPNLQQVSGKDENEHLHSDSEILNGLVIRKLFIPEEGCDWLKMDWSQIEYRLIAHYAVGSGAEKIRERYNEDPNVDYHNEMGEMAGLTDRKIVKTLNFGAAYGMGVNKMASTYGWDQDEAVEIYRRYHREVPFVKETSNRVGLKAKRVGFIRTIYNRRARLRSKDKTYVMFNRLIQGSAADIMKKAMSDAYYAGVFQTLYPHLTVHDEMDSSMPRTKEGQEAGKELKNIMENCIKLKVPIKADCEIGPNWGELEEWNV